MQRDSVHHYFNKLNTKYTKEQKKQPKQLRQVQNTLNRKQLPTTHSGKTGCLSMVLNQRQRLTDASDWEPYQAKTRNTKHRTKT